MTTSMENQKLKLCLWYVNRNSPEDSGLGCSKHLESLALALVQFCKTEWLLVYCQSPCEQRPDLSAHQQMQG